MFHPNIRPSATSDLASASYAGEASVLRWLS